MLKNIYLAFILLIVSFGHNAWAQSAIQKRKLEFKGDKKSSTQWGNINIDNFLSYRIWRDDSDVRDQVPDWEEIVRERNHHEMIGRIYQCVGQCRVDRGEGFFNGSYRSALYEGDEIYTLSDSYVWIFLFDGTLVRLSPHSSITLNELNIGAEENFLNARINSGNVLWLSRLEQSFIPKNLRETDMLFFPYAEYESLPVHEVQKESESIIEFFLKDPLMYENHYLELNKKIVENNKLTNGKKTYAFLVLPNATVMGYAPNVEFISLLGGKSYVKKRTLSQLGLEAGESEQSEVEIQLRGFENKTLITLNEDQWMMVDEKGRHVVEEEQVNQFSIGEFITRRIPSIMHAREIFLGRYSEFAFRKKYDALKLAKEDGYRLWGKINSSDKSKKDDLELRLDYLKEYFRRVETSNLLTREKFVKRLEERGEKLEGTEYGDYFYQTAMHRYYVYGEILKDQPQVFDDTEVLNSTKKLLWKKMHGIR